MRSTKTIYSNKRGERKIQTQSNMQACVIDMIGDKDVVVMFEDGTTLSEASYRAFRKGKLIKPKFCRKSVVGEKSVDICGEPIRIINYIADNNITVVNDKLQIRRRCTISDFRDGRIDMDEIDEPIFLAEMTDKERSAGAAAIRNMTIAAIENTLSKYGRCYVSRLCGFGKTHIVVDAVARWYKKVLYVHPSSEFAKNGTISSKNIKFITYMKLCAMKIEDIKKMDYDLVVFDECHHIGGTEDGRGAAVTFKKIQEMMKWHPDSNYLGLTGTDVRMDGIDVEKEIFGNKSVFHYNWFDAVADGYIDIPNYFINVINTEQFFSERYRGVRDYKVREKFKSIISRDAFKEIYSDVLEKIDLKYIPHELAEVFEAERENGEYMKFIITYPKIWDIDNERGGVYKEAVKRWFEAAFPNHKVRLHLVHTGSNITKNDVENFKPQEGVIDLIICVNMYIEEFHDDKHLRGVVLARSTTSYPLYEQMISRISDFLDGRVKRQKKIIIDIYDNLHNEFKISETSSKVKREDVEMMLAKKREAREEFDRVIDEIVDERESSALVYKNTLKRLLASNPEAKDWDKIDNDVKEGIKAITKKTGKSTGDVIKDIENSTSREEATEDVGDSGTLEDTIKSPEDNAKAGEPEIKSQPEKECECHKESKEIEESKESKESKEKKETKDDEQEDNESAWLLIKKQIEDEQKRDERQKATLLKNGTANVPAKGAKQTPGSMPQKHDEKTEKTGDIQGKMNGKATNKNNKADESLEEKLKHYRQFEPGLFVRFKSEDLRQTAIDEIIDAMKKAEERIERERKDRDIQKAASMFLILHPEMKEFIIGNAFEISSETIKKELNICAKLNYCSPENVLDYIQKTA